MIAVLLGIAVALSEPLQAASDIFSVNIYGYGKGGADRWDQPDWRETVTLEAGQSAGVGDWHTSGWENYNGTSSMGITSTQGSTATIKVDNVRNYSPYYWTAKRSTLLGDGYSISNLSWGQRDRVRKCLYFQAHAR